MIRTLLLVVWLGICILIGIGFLAVPFLIGFDLETSDISLIGFSVFTGWIIVAGSFRALISAIGRSRS